MDASAVVLMALVYGGNEQILANLPASWAQNKLVKVLLAQVIAIAAIFLVAATVWSNEQVVGGQQLDQLDFWSKVLAGVLVGFGSSVVQRTVSAVRNIGENDRAIVAYNPFDKNVGAQHPDGGDDLYPLPESYRPPSNGG